jgi:hypothetical protein
MSGIQVLAAIEQEKRGWPGRRYDLEDDAVVDGLSCRITEGRKVDLLNFDAAGFEVNHATIGIGRHLQSPLGSV